MWRIIYKGSLYISKSKHKRRNCNECATLDNYLIMNKNTNILTLKLQFFIVINTVDLGLYKI